MDKVELRACIEGSSVAAFYEIQVAAKIGNLGRIRHSAIVD
jgi:hypothetical protein